MADEADIAQQHELEVAKAISDHIQATRFTGTSARYCEFCDEPIPEARRKAVPGVRHCVECQSYLEKRR